eukprot:3936830-Rhodomonas_salina.3
MAGLESERVQSTKELAAPAGLPQQPTLPRLSMSSPQYSPSSAASEVEDYHHHQDSNMAFRRSISFDSEASFDDETCYRAPINIFEVPAKISRLRSSEAFAPPPTRYVRKRNKTLRSLSSP